MQKNGRSSRSFHVKKQTDLEKGNMTLSLMAKMLLCIRKNVLRGLDFEVPKPIQFKSLSKHLETSNDSIKHEKWKAHVHVGIQGKEQCRFFQYIISIHVL